MRCGLWLPHFFCPSCITFVRVRVLHQLPGFQDGECTSLRAWLPMLCSMVTVPCACFVASLRFTSSIISTPIKGVRRCELSPHLAASTTHARVHGYVVRRARPGSLQRLWYGNTHATCHCSPCSLNCRTGPTWLLPFKWLTQELYYYYYYISVSTSRPCWEAVEVYTTLGATVLGGVVSWYFGFGTKYLVLMTLPGRLAGALLIFTFDYLPHRPHDTRDKYKGTNVTSVVGDITQPLTPVLLYVRDAWRVRSTRRCSPHLCLVGAGTKTTTTFTT